MREILHTKACDLFGIKYPIVLAGMGGVSGPTLAAAVSNAGGLGIMGVTGLSPEQIRKWIREIRNLTDKPFGADLLLPMKFSRETMDEVRSKITPEHTAFISKLEEELNLPHIKGWLEMNFSEELVQSKIEAILEERVPVFAAGLGITREVVLKAHDHGTKVITCVGNVRQALMMAETGVDVIVAQGHEAGGHTGRIGTMALVPQVVDAVYPIPVLAAGGIADGRGLAATLALGAIGAWIGTAFCATHEATVDHAKNGIELSQFEAEAYKQSLVKATEEDTRISKLYTGKTARLINSKLIEAWERSGLQALPMPHQSSLITDLTASLSIAGMSEYITWFGGQIVGAIREIKSAEEVLNNMVSETVEILSTRFAENVRVEY